MERKKIAIIATALIAVLGLIAVKMFWDKTDLSETPADVENQGQAAPAPTGPITREAAPKDMVVPDTNSINVPENVAVPTVISAVRAGTDAKNRIFEITAEGDKFTPDTAVVKKGDEIKINITATDKDYAFTQPDFGFNVAIPKGQKKLISFMGSAEGKFKFYCGSCGGPEKGPVGYVVIMPKD